MMVVARIGLAVADGSVQYDELLQWILDVFVNKKVLQKGVKKVSTFNTQ